MDHLGRYLLYILGATAAGIGGGYLISKILTRRTEKNIGGKLMHVHYRFSKDFEPQKK